jgi:hypothetical protein
MIKNILLNLNAKRQKQNKENYQLYEITKRRKHSKSMKSTVVMICYANGFENS